MAWILLSTLKLMGSWPASAPSTASRLRIPDLSRRPRSADDPAEPWGAPDALPSWARRRRLFTEQATEVRAHAHASLLRAGVLAAGGPHEPPRMDDRAWHHLSSAVTSGASAFEAAPGCLSSGLEAAVRAAIFDRRWQVVALHHVAVARLHFSGIHTLIVWAAATYDPALF
jgi:hypothetical protein